MFNASILSSSLKEIVDVLKVKSDFDILVHGTPDGLRTRFIDVANVFMVDANIPDTAFNKYPIDVELHMAIELSRLSTFVDSVDEDGRNEEIIRLEYDEINHTLCLTSRYMSTVQKQVTPYQMRSSPKRLHLDWQGMASISADDFVRAVNAMYKMKAPEGLDGCDYVEMGVRPLHSTGKEGIFYMEAKFDKGKKDFDEFGFKKLCTDSEPISISKEVKSMFSIDYLECMVHSLSTTGNIEILLGTDIPVKFKFTLPKSGAIIEYTYACRDETEEVEVDDEL